MSDASAFVSQVLDVKRSSGSDEIPRRWRRAITGILVLVLALLLFGGPFVSFSIWREDLHRFIRPIAVGLFILITLRKVVLGRRSLTPTLRKLLGQGRGLRHAHAEKEEAATRQEGGLLFIAIVVEMLLWWIASTLKAGTGEGSIVDTVVWDPTVSTQLWLSCLAMSILAGSEGAAIDLGKHLGRWFLSYFVFLTAMGMMIADTDYQYQVAALITWDDWILWRILNFSLIVPYLVGGLLVVRGVSLKLVCGVGAVSIPIVYFLLWVFGVAP